ncbi:hypothetical protein BX285_6194 [Streptomyces sp. 1114.5]|uniref:hypothetical protein n=1 Tax=Streptomyces sp. 1114.5 TaxID=1938830 RepID=UPI000EAE0D73|nr:hypothetical protein [Streptomyces sp. 1114.5]RKT12227.1 hypothetical protein BX285_6194 [Streptomyces sp. 1114.5]
MTRIVGVHGVGNYRPDQTVGQAADTLSEVWGDRLARTLATVGEPLDRSDVRVAYYADLLRHPGRQGRTGGFDELGAFEQQLVQEWLETLPLPGGVSAGRLTAPLRQAVAWIAETRGLGRRATEWFVSVFFREVAAYLGDADGAARAAARDRVASAIADTGSRIVIAHSLGSVVAYEALWERPDLRVDLLITLGSPLALPHAVFPRLQPPPRNDRGRRPPNVGRWVNLADPGDLVAIPPGGVERRFDGVDLQESSATAIHAFDFHLVANYLSLPGLGYLLRSDRS